MFCALAQQYTVSRLNKTLISHVYCLHLRSFSNKAKKLQEVRTFSKPTVKPYYLTTPIFYPNAEPHIGHLYSLVIADILARYRRLVNPNQPVRFITGTDEHGLKIQKTAKDKGVTERELVDKLSERFKELAKKVNVSYTRFVRTSSDSHKGSVQYLWRKLASLGYIYKSAHTGFYSITDECFYSSTQIASRTNPKTGTEELFSAETGSIVEWAEEVNWKFRLSEFREQLIEHLERKPKWIQPSTRHDLVLRSLLAARTNPSLLPDLSVSRPRSRLTWGVPVPDDAEQTIYVWLDALSAYLTGVGYPWKDDLEMKENGWPCNLHVIGKDILKFHAIYFPAFLFALDLPLPGGILSHAHWTSNRTKMSKSIGNVVAPIPLLSSPIASSPSGSRTEATTEEAKTDTIRWYLSRVGGRFRDDVDWSSEQLEKYTDELRDVLGNLVLRITGEKVLARIKKDVYWATIPLDRGVLSDKSKEKGVEWKEELRGLKERYEGHMERLEIGDSVDSIVSVLSLANTHFTQTRPWSPQTPLASAIDTFIWTRETLRISGILLQPFVPTLAGRLLDALQVREGERALNDASVGHGRVEPGAVRRVLLVPKESSGKQFRG